MFAFITKLTNVLFEKQLNFNKLNNESMIDQIETSESTVLSCLAHISM